MKIDNLRPYIYFLFLQLLCCLTQSSPTRQESLDVLQSNLDNDSTLKCSEDKDCHDLILCRDNKTNCFCNTKSSKCDWKDHTIRPRWRRSVSDLALSEDDIGPDTCGKDRKVLSNWFLTHGSPNLLEDPIPENVLPTFPNPYDDPNKPPLQPDEVSGRNFRDEYRKSQDFLNIRVLNIPLIYIFFDYIQDTVGCNGSQGKTKVEITHIN